MSDNTVIQVRHACMHFNMTTEKIDSLKEYILKLLKRQLFFRDFIAVDDVSFDVERGEVFGIVGTNGSGKSTLLKMISGILKPTHGTIDVTGNIAPLIELGAGFDGDLSARENIFLNGAVLGYSKEFIEQHFNKIVEFAELADFLDVPIKNYSSGMVARIAFAIATIITPDILIVDEILSVGDFLFQQKCEKRIRELMELGTTVLIVSHSIEQIEKLCTRALWIEKSQVRLMGSAWEVCNAYRGLSNQDTYVEMQKELFETVSTEKCWVCGETNEFRVEKGVTLLREAVCKHCGASIRASDLSYLIAEQIFGAPAPLIEKAAELSQFKILICSSTGVFNSVFKGIVDFDYIDFYTQNTIEHSPFANLSSGHYDYIISEEIIKHSYNYLVDFAQIYRILKKDGMHFFTVPMHEGRKTNFRLKQNRREVRLPGADGRQLLVTIDWGDDIFQILNQFGFQTCGEKLHDFHTKEQITDVDMSYESCLATHPYFYYRYNSFPCYSQKVSPVRECVSTDMCNCCGSFAGFYADKGVTLKREATCASCGASLRNSDMAFVLVDQCLHAKGPLSELKSRLRDRRILNTSSTGVFHQLLGDLPQYVAFEYFDDVNPGEYVNGVLSNDLQNLTFDNMSFDLIISEDVFEHVDNVSQALEQVNRVLDSTNGWGIHLFTVPLHQGRKSLFRRGLQPYYHVDPIRPQGALVTVDWGDDLCEIFDNYGFKTTQYCCHKFYDNDKITNVDKSFEQYCVTHAFFYYHYNSDVFLSRKKGEGD